MPAKVAAMLASPLQRALVLKQAPGVYRRPAIVLPLCERRRRRSVLRHDKHLRFRSPRRASFIFRGNRVGGRPRRPKKGETDGAASGVAVLVEIVYLIRVGVGCHRGCHSNQVTTSSCTAHYFTSEYSTRAFICM